MNYKKYLSINFLLCLLFASNSIIAQKKANVISEMRNGLTTVKFETKEGNITTYLPTDIHVGDVISGTVFTEPKGKDEKQILKNKNILNGYVVELEGKKTPVKKGKETWALPEMLNEGLLKFFLKNEKGQILDRISISVDNEIRSIDSPDKQKEGNLGLPSYIRAGEIEIIPGWFDGDFSTSGIIINEEGVDLLAESPANLFFKSPDDIIGKAEIKVVEGELEIKDQINIIDLELSADKLHLLKGDRANITVRIIGLNDFDEDVPIEISNLSKGIITMEGGDDQIKIIKPENILPDGSCSINFNVTASRAGGFSIMANIKPSAPNHNQFFNTIGITPPAPKNADKTSQAQPPAQKNEKAEQNPKKKESDEDDVKISQAIPFFNKYRSLMAAVQKKTPPKHQTSASVINYKLYLMRALEGRDTSNVVKLEGLLANIKLPEGYNKKNYLSRLDWWKAETEREVAQLKKSLSSGAWEEILSMADSINKEKPVDKGFPECPFVFTIKSFEGSVSYQLPGDASWKTIGQRDIVMGRRFPVGTKFSTGFKSSLVLEVEISGTEIYVSGSSQITLSKYLIPAPIEGKCKWSVDIQYGGVRVKVVKDVPGSDFRVQTGSANASPQGTIFSVFYDDILNESTIEIFDGSVEVEAKFTSEKSTITGNGKNKSQRAIVNSSGKIIISDINANPNNWTF